MNSSNRIVDMGPLKNDFEFLVLNETHLEKLLIYASSSQGKL